MTSMLTFLRRGVKFGRSAQATITVRCPPDQTLISELRAAVEFRMTLLVDGIRAACQRVTEERSAAGLPFMKRRTKHGVSAVLPPGTCDTCGGDLPGIVVRGGKQLIVLGHRGGMCDLCSLAVDKLRKARVTA